ncbi:acyltransferase [Alcanivorax sp. N3-2A]|nr:acyltransferase [Alcanivorax sp. N3-2A]
MSDPYRQQHQRRLSYMPWLYARLKPRHRQWALPWQEMVQAELQRLETVRFGAHCFVAPEAHLFAEPGRDIEVGAHTHIAAECVLHGPIRLGEGVSLNHHVTLEGGAAGIDIGDETRIASYCTLYAFDHGLDAARPIRAQPVTSRGIRIGRDVWLGARVGVVDGVRIGDHAVVGMGAVVTRDVPPWTIVAGNPARPIGRRPGAPPVTRNPAPDDFPSRNNQA